MKTTTKIKTVIVTGPTATGKTALAVKLARVFNGEIISADSRQVYKGLDLGTGKDIDEYSTGGNPVKYHLIDVCEPNIIYNLRRFNFEAKVKIEDIAARNKLPIISGGTVSYLDSLISDYKFPLSPPDTALRKELDKLTTEEVAERIKIKYPDVYRSIDNKTSRPRLVRAYENLFVHEREQVFPELESNSEFLIIGTYFPRKKVHERIRLRLKARFDEGMLEEVETLHKNGVSWERLDSFGLEYRFISQYLKNEISYEEMFENLLAKIRRLARSQDIWFRKLENKGVDIYWLREDELDKAEKLIADFLDNKDLEKPDLALKNIYYGPKSA